MPFDSASKPETISGPGWFVGSGVAIPASASRSAAAEESGWAIARTDVGTTLRAMPRPARRSPSKKRLANPVFLVHSAVCMRTCIGRARRQEDQRVAHAAHDADVENATVVFF